MPPPSSLSIKTSSVNRLIKEESYYRQETVRQRAVVAELEAKEGVDEYELRQPRQVLQQTEVMAPEVRKRLGDAVEILEIQLADAGAAEGTKKEDLEKAEKAVRDGKEVIEKYGLGG